MRKSLYASVLLLLLCCPAFAGDMLTPPIASPKSAKAVKEPAPSYEIPCLPLEEEEIFTQITVNLVESVLALF